MDPLSDFSFTQYHLICWFIIFFSQKFYLSFNMLKSDGVPQLLSLIGLIRGY